MTPPLQRVIDRLRREINNRINGAIQRVVLSALDDSGGLQVATVKGVGDHVRRAERIQPAGLTSSPTAGEGVQVAIGGNTDHPIVVALENRAKRPNTAPGETKLYNEFGSEVHQKIDGTTEIHAGGAVDPVVDATQLKAFLDNLNTAWVTAPNDGGAALKTALTTALATLWGPVPTTKLKAE